MIRHKLDLYENNSAGRPEGSTDATPERVSAPNADASYYMRPMGASPMIDLETLRGLDEGATDGTSRLAEKAERVEPTDTEWDMGEPVVCQECGHFDPAHAMWCHSVGFDDGEARDYREDVS